MALDTSLRRGVLTPIERSLAAGEAVPGIRGSDEFAAPMPAARFPALPRDIRQQLRRPEPVGSALPIQSVGTALPPKDPCDGCGLAWAAFVSQLD